MRLKLTPPSNFRPEKLLIKYCVFSGVVLGLTLPTVAHSQTLQRDRFPTQQAQASPGSRYNRLSLGYPTPITDQYGVTGVTPNIQEWYNRVLAKMRSTPAPGEVTQPYPLQLTAPESTQESPPSYSPTPTVPRPVSPTTAPPAGGGARGGEFTPQDRGAPSNGGAGGARFRPPTILKVPD